MSKAINAILAAEVIGGVSHKCVMCTPELAKTLLELNTHNRKIKMGVVEKYCHEIINGEWYAMAAGVGIDDHGVLTDGQQRLTAIVKSGVPVPLLIVWGLPPSSQQKADRQDRRSMFDVLTLAGIISSRKAVQVATYFCRRGNSTEGTNGREVVADSDVKALYLAMQEAIDPVCKLFSQSRAHTHFDTVGVVSACVEAWQIDPAQTQAFVEKLYVPTELQLNDPRFRLRRWLLEVQRTGRGGAAQDADFEATMFCLDAFFNGRFITQVRRLKKMEIEKPVANR